MSRPLVLVVDDDQVLRGVLIVALRSHGYEVKPAATGQQALNAIEARTPDVMILDLALPDIDGFAVIAEVRRKHELPIIILSARDDEQNQIRALDGGANDYVTKPFREGELMARLRVALRRPVALSERRELRVGDLFVDAIQRRVFIAEAEVTLTSTEFKLIHALARESPRVVTHQHLLREVWGSAHVGAVQYLRVYMKQLRSKIEVDPSRPARIITALGAGYQLVNPESAT